MSSSFVGNSTGLSFITAIDLQTREDGSTEIFIDMTNPAIHETFTLSGPDRIVLDLQNTRGQSYINRQQFNNDLISDIRSAQHENGKLRIVLDLKGPASVSSGYVPGKNLKGHRLSIKATAINPGETTPGLNRTAVAASFKPVTKQEKIDVMPAGTGSLQPRTRSVPLIIDDKRYPEVQVSLDTSSSMGTVSRQALLDAISPLLNNDSVSRLQSIMADNEMVPFSALQNIGIEAGYRSDTAALHIDIPETLTEKPEGLVQVIGAILETMSGERDRLTLTLDGQAVHNIFVLTEPDRIVIDLENTVGVNFINGRSLANELVQLVRGGAHDGDRLRVVLDLNGPAYANSRLTGPDEEGNYALSIDISRIPIPEPPAKQEPEQKELNRPEISYDSDQIQLTLNYERAPLGTIDAIEYSGGYMLASSQLFQVLGFRIDVSMETGIAEGWFIRPNKLFALDVTKGNVIIEGVEKTFSEDLVQARNHDIYIDSSLLSRFFPVLFKVNPSSLTLTLTPDTGMPEPERQEMIDQWLMVNGRKKPGPVDQPVQHAEDRRSGQPAGGVETTTTVPEAGEVEEINERQEIRQAATLKEIPEELFAELSEEDIVVLQPFIDDEPVDDFIESYQIEERFLVPLQVISEILYFVIEVDPAAGVADGWFISEDRTINLNLADATVTLSGATEAVPENHIYRTDFDIFIDTQLLSQWFPLNFEVDLNTLALAIYPRELLPFQEREQRMREWNRLQFRKQEEKNYAPVDLPYQAASIPFMDLNMGQEYNNSGEHKNTSSYSLRASGDLGYLSTEVFTHGDNIDHLMDSLRITSGRQSDTATLLGPLRATSFSLGDIDSITIPLVAQSSLGRGFTVTNRPLVRASEFDATNFIGDALPGWDVELYRNGALIDSFIVGDDGRYEFLEVPILFGNNTFQLIFHGPEGQIQEEVRRFNIGDSFLNKGELNYEFSIDEKSRPLLDVGEKEVFDHQNAVRAGGELEYGISKTITSTLGLMTTPLEDREHLYLSAGVKSGFSSFYGSMDTAWDQTNNGWAARFSTFGQLWDMNLKAEYSIYNNFASEMLRDIDLPLSNRTFFGMNGTFTLPLIDDFNFNLDIDRQQFDSGLTRTTIRNRLAKSLLGMRVTNSVEHNLTDSGNTSYGDLSLRGRYKGILFRANMLYRLVPEMEASIVEVSAQKKFLNDLVAQAFVSQELDNGWVTRLGGSLNWERDYYRLSLTADIDSEKNINVGGNIVFSLGRLPERGGWHIQSKSMAGQGGVLPRAFLDRNLNQKFDEQDELLDNARYRVGMNSISTDNGTAVAMGLPVNRYTDIEIDTTGLEDPLWTPSVEGYKVIARPGVLANVDFPIIESSEIDGIVYLIDAEGNERPLSRIVVVLVDTGSGGIAKKFRSEFDGYYLIEKVHPGNYFIRISRDDLDRLSLEQIEEQEITITGESDIYNGYDIRLRRKEEL